MRKKRKKRILTVLVTALFLLESTTAFAAEIPISQSVQTVDGTRTLVQVFQVDRTVDPDSLVESDLKQGGYRYSRQSVVKKVLEKRDVKDVRESVRITVHTPGEAASEKQALLKMPAFLEYARDGYHGTLYAVPATLSGKISGRKTHTGTRQYQKTYEREYNDDSLIPKEQDGYRLSGVSWAEGSYLENSSVPEGYVATATYQKPYRYTSVTGWNYSMDYVGKAEKVDDHLVEYTVTYEGKKIGLFEKLFGKDGRLGTRPVLKLALLFAGLLLGGLLLLALLALLRALYRAWKYGKAVIYARDELTGGFYELGRKRLFGKEPVIRIDPLLAPAAVLFRVLLPAYLAGRIRGKVLRIEAAETVIEHKVEGKADLDEVIDIPVS